MPLRLDEEEKDKKKEEKEEEEEDDDDEEEGEDEDEDEDSTTIKKPEHDTRPLSPESNDSETSPFDANLLAQEKIYLVSPEPVSPSGTDRSACQPSVLYDRTTIPLTRKPVASTMEERLLAMPQLRSLPWREGVEPGSDIEVGGDSRRKQIRFGCLLATRGDVAPKPCRGCANGRGKFTACIALPEYFRGACASCQLSGSPNKCSIKQTEDQVSPISKTQTKAETIPRVFQTPQTAPIGYVSQLEPPELAPAAIHLSDPPLPRLKRQKRHVEDASWRGNRPQWKQEINDAQHREQLTQRSQPSAPASTSTSPSVIKSPNGAQSATNSFKQFLPTPANPAPSIGWATVNHPPLKSSSHITHTNNGTQYKSHANETGNGNKPRQHNEQERNEDIILNMDASTGSVAMIDKLPKSKQRVVYGLVSGLQGGITLLQRELDSLKNVLGIDDEC